MNYNHGDDRDLLEPIRRKKPQGWYCARGPCHGDGNVCGLYDSPDCPYAEGT